jgi:glycosyltransferase involved in cell wall biosynthesis
MTVTVAICTWNRSAALRMTLSQLTRLRVPSGVDWELLVVNNNCTDDTDAVCESFAAQLPIRVLHEPTPGQSRARNLAIQEARGSVICWTDDDVIVDPGWLESLLSTMDRYRAEWAFGASEPTWPAAAPSWYAPRLRGYFAALNYGPTAFAVTDDAHPFYGLNFAGSREAHLALGGFRNEFGFRGKGGGVGEDLDMFMRALEAGMTIVYTPDATVQHVISPERLKKHYHRRRQWVANRVYYQHLTEVFPNVPWLLGLPRFFYGNAAKAGVGYLRSAVRRDASERFEHELAVLRFVRLMGESARQGFSKRPASGKPAARSNHPSGVGL